MIRIIGLGIADGDISMRAYEALESTRLAVFKTGETATYALSERIGVSHITLDDIYEESEDFDDVNSAVVDRLIALATEHGDIAYLVLGSGSDDRTVKMLLDKGIDIEMYTAPAKESTFLGIGTSYIALSAYDIVNERVFMPDTAYPLVVKDIDNRGIASALKLVLTEVFDDELVVRISTLNGEKSIPLYALDRQSEYCYYTAICLEASDYTKKEKFTFADLLRIMYRLRDRETGCMWDKVQTHETIRKNMIEEAYELVTAIDNGDIANMLEECGDVMLQSVFHSVIAEDMGEFDMYEVISALCKKLVTRHTHIFGDVVATTSEEALAAWESAKAKEKSTTAFSEKLDSIAEGLPQMMRASKVQRQASKRGLDFASVEDAAAKIGEELREFLEADGDAKEMEAGDLLFAVINVLRMSGVDGEVALRRSVDKFVARCKRVEEYALRDGIDMDNMSPEVFDTYWEESKSHEDR